MPDQQPAVPLALAKRTNSQCTRAAATPLPARIRCALMHGLNRIDDENAGAEGLAAATISSRRLGDEPRGGRPEAKVARACHCLATPRRGVENRTSALSAAAALQHERDLPMPGHRRSG